MGIRLDRFSSSPKNRLMQARDLNNLVHYEQDWLEEARPDTFKGYEHFLKSVRRVGNVALSTTLEAFIIRDDHSKIAVGMATIIPRASVKHSNPEIGIVSGNNLDYWLGQKNGQGFHKETAESLVRLGRKLKIDHREGAFGGRTSVATYPSVFTAVQAGEINPPLGLMASIPSLLPDLRLLPFGAPDYLQETENYDDIYKIAAVGQETQLYYLSGKTEIR